MATVTIGVAGCSSEGVVGGPYQRALEQARSSATSDFERGVLEDLQIDRGEYQEAVQRYVACASGRGVNLAAEVEQATGLYRFSYDNPRAGEGSPTSADSVVDECRAGTTDLIEPLYSDMRMNPQKVDLLQAAVECLVARGAVPEGFSRTDLENGMRQGTAGLAGIDKEILSSCLTPPGLHSGGTGG
ncbi:MAG: hypothetical protein MUF33_11220 [Candidatus Nanopelagicales bacterium]|nr:hypothetical protein [Candidatus Nanopelagicales bacterium]